MGMQTIEIIGNLGRDFEIRYDDKGDPVGRASVAVTPPKYGNKEPVTSWYSITIWGKRAESLAQYLVKGKQVFVRGELQAGIWTNNEGQPKLDLSIRVNDIQLLGTKGEGGGSSGGAQGGWDDFATAPPAGKPQRPVFGNPDHKEPEGAEPF